MNAEVHHDLRQFAPLRSERAAHLVVIVMVMGVGWAG